MIDVRAVTFEYHLQPVLNAVDLQVQTGELVELHGANGSGKSTLLQLLAGLLAPSHGSIHLSPELQGAGAPAFLPAEANGLYAKLNALENLRFWLGLQSQAPRDAALLAGLQTWGIAARIAQFFPIENLSTGMKRRVAMARLSLLGSKLWLLDEPLYGLDDAGCKQFAAALREHAAQGGAAVIVSHDRSIFAGLQIRTLRLEGRKLV